MNIEIKSYQELVKTPSVPYLVQNSDGMIILVTEWERRCGTFSGVVLDEKGSLVFRNGQYRQDWTKTSFSLLPPSTKITLSND